MNAVYCEELENGKLETLTKLYTDYFNAHAGTDLLLQIKHLHESEIKLNRVQTGEVISISLRNMTDEEFERELSCIRLEQGFSLWKGFIKQLQVMYLSTLCSKRFQIGMKNFL